MSFYRKSYRPRRGGEEPEKCADPAKARARALDALASREMSSAQLYERLCYGFTEQAAAAAVAEMVELDYVNDDRYAETRAHGLLMARKSRRAAAQNLRRKYRILDSIQRKKLSLQRRSNEHSTFRREEGNDRCFRVPFFPIIRKDLTDQKDNTCHSQTNQPGQQKPEQHAVCRDPAVPCQNGGCDSNDRSCHCFG